MSYQLKHTAEDIDIKLFRVAKNIIDGDAEGSLVQAPCDNTLAEDTEAKKRAISANTVAFGVDSQAGMLGYRLTDATSALQDGWNHIEIPLADFTDSGYVDPISSFRLYNKSEIGKTDADTTIMLKNVYGMTASGESISLAITSDMNNLTADEKANMTTWNKSTKPQWRTVGSITTLTYDDISGGVGYTFNGIMAANASGIKINCSHINKGSIDKLCFDLFISDASNVEYSNWRVEFNDGKLKISDKTLEELCNLYGTNAGRYALMGYSTGYEVGDRFSIHTAIDEKGNSRITDLCGKIIWITGNTVCVDNYIKPTIVADPMDDLNALWVPEKPAIGNIEIGGFSFASGYNTKALGAYSHATGKNTFAYGKYAHAEGHTTQAAYSSHAEGRNTIASGQSCHAEGWNTTANGNYAHAEGHNSIATGVNAHVEGWSCEATGESSHAEGHKTKANGTRSHAAGYNTVADGSYQYVYGRSNIPSSNYIHIVGNGKWNAEKQEDTRSNAHTLDWDGNAWFAGNVTVGDTDNQVTLTGTKVVSKDGLFTIPGGTTKWISQNNGIYTAYQKVTINLNTKLSDDHIVQYLMTSLADNNNIAAFEDKLSADGMSVEVTFYAVSIPENDVTGKVVCFNVGV